MIATSTTLHSVAAVGGRGRQGRIMESDADNGTGSDAEKAAGFTNELEV